MTTVDLVWTRHEMHGRWWQHDTPPWATRSLWYGRILWGPHEGRWYLQEIGQISTRARLVDGGEVEARAAVEARMAELGGTWEQVPCHPTGGWRDGERH